MEKNRPYYYALPILKLLTFCLCLFACTLPFGLLAGLGLFDIDPTHPTLPQIVLSQFFAVVMVLGALLMVFQLFKLYDFEHVFIVRYGALSAFAKGTLVGFLLIVICATLAFVSGNVSFSFRQINVISIAWCTLLFIFVAVFEEFLFRSFPLTVLAERYPKEVAILVTSLLFGLAHLTNDGFTWLAMVNITLAGILFSLIILYTRNIFWAVGLHFGWNVTQGVILGYQVSGTDAAGFLTAKPMGSVYLSGGTFGIESSVYCTLAMLATIIFMLVKYQFDPVVEMQFEENEKEF